MVLQCWVGCLTNPQRKYHHFTQLCTGPRAREVDYRNKSAEPTKDGECSVQQSSYWLLKQDSDIHEINQVGTT
jgi:hypothetical protein